MKTAVPKVLQNYSFDGLNRFTGGIRARKCCCYASDFLGADYTEPRQIEQPIQHTLEIFKTLGIPAEKHFYSVYRYTSDQQLFKDWRVSQLACAYMLLNGDPTDPHTIAKQQNKMIDDLLDFLNTTGKVHARQ